MSLYDRPVRVLMREMADSMGLAPGQEFTRDDALDWFKSHYPLVKDGTITAHLTRLSTNNKNRVHYSAKTDDDVFFQIDTSRFRRFDPVIDPPPIRDVVGEVPPDPGLVAPPADQASEFAYEHDLRDYLARNLYLLEPGLRLYEEEGVTGVEFPAGGRYIDVLAVDSDGNLVVIELKVSKGYDRVLGQLLRYMGWIERHHADPGQTVRGVIVAKAISDDLKLASTRIRDIRLFEYELAVALRPVSA